MYYTLIKHMPIWEHAFLECSQMPGVFYHSNAWLRLHLIYDIEAIQCGKNHGLLTNQSMHRVLSIYNKTYNTEFVVMTRISFPLDL